MFIVLPASKRKNSTHPSFSLRIGASRMQEVTSLKILGVLLTSDLSRREHCKSTCNKVSSKLCTLQRFGASLNIKTRSHLYKAYIKPDIEYCLPVWGNHNTAQAAFFNKLLTRAKRIITRNVTANLCKADFNTFCFADFHTIVFFTVPCQLFYYIHSNNNFLNFTFTVLSDVGKPMATRASESFKLPIVKTKKSCDNCVLFKAPKLWNLLPNNVTCIKNFNAFHTSVVKHLFK